MRVDPARPAAAGIDASSSARPISAHTRIGRRRTRSTHTPATRPKSRLGREPAAASNPICEGVALRTSTAVSGSATAVMAVPAPEVTWATHRRRNAGFRHRFGGWLIGLPALAQLQSYAQSTPLRHAPSPRQACQSCPAAATPEMDLLARSADNSPLHKSHRIAPVYGWRARNHQQDGAGQTRSYMLGKGHIGRNRSSSSTIPLQRRTGSMPCAPTWGKPCQRRRKLPVPSLHIIMAE